MLKVNDVIEILKQNSANSIKVDVNGETSKKSHFGGVPKLPESVEYPMYECSTYEDDDIKLRPLHFLAQIDLAEVSKFDEHGLLPKNGTLLFFYRTDSNIWGFDPKDKGAWRVIYWDGEEKTNETEQISEFPEISINFSKETSYPDISTLKILTGKEINPEIYDEALKKLDSDVICEHKMLGYADVIQNPPEYECELLSRGYYLGNGYPKLPDSEKIKREAMEEWVLLLQLGTVNFGESELMFGDCGRIYFYIKKKDLKKRDFDNVRMILQC